MNRIIAITNQKGGVGKTTTAINLAACIANEGHKTLLIDLDPQGNATSGLGFDKNDQEKTSYDVVLGHCKAEEAILHTNSKKLDLIPSNVDLSGAEVELAEMEIKQYLLKAQILVLKDEYEYIIIDCPPSLGLLTVNALTAADTALVPIQCEYFALEGLSQLIQTVDMIREALNPELKIEGIVFTMFDIRTRLANDVVNNVRENLQLHVYKTAIPRNVRLAEAPSYGMPIIDYDYRCSGSRAYRKLAKEVIKREDI
ncbi:MAG: ParA family protein [Lachnospiraceae bacterium]|nr:ParA family protein [Lachnospiraceae bacterium]